MGSSRTRAVLSAVKTALASINGAGVYTYDLSADGKVQIGRPAPNQGPTPPCAWVAVGELDSSHGPQVGRYRRDLVVDILAFAPAEADTTEARQFVGADLLDDICAALEASRTLGGLVLDLIVQGGTFNGADAGMPGCAGVLARVAVHWHANSAAGV